jgi:hypothetical protein
LRPPDHLPDRARAHFVNLVGACAVAHFKPSDLELLCAWAETCVAREEAAFHMTQPGGLVDAEGRKSVWVIVHSAACKTLADLAKALRVGPMQRTRKAPKREPGPMGAFERYRLEGGLDDDERDIGRG